MTTYLACPVKYRWTYIDARGKWFLRSKSYYSFGTSLHNVLERLHDSDDAGVTTVHQAQAALEEGWIDAGFDSQAEMMEAMAEGKEIIAAYVDEMERTPTTEQTKFVEKTLRLEFEDFVLLGRIDRLDEGEDGTLTVVDYKSGRGHVTEEDVAGDLAMAVYQLLVRENFPGQPVRATLIALRTGKSATASLPESELEQLKIDLEVLYQEIANQEWHELHPRFKPICPDCDFVALCRRDPDFAEAYSAAVSDTTMESSSN